jgi:hypothetical protein
MIYSCLYNAPIIYYALILHEGSSFTVEQHDHYTKQTYRNRCRILGGNGVIDLAIPVVKNHGKKTFMKDIIIDEESPWRAIHWKSINSAYASSPFFEFVSDYYLPLYSKKQKYLIDFNCKLLSVTLELLNIGLKYSLSDSFKPSDSSTDLRESIHPKRPFESNTLAYKLPPYQQVFSDRHGFKEDLSILDLLFNEGQSAGQILRSSLSEIHH